VLIAIRFVSKYYQICLAEGGPRIFSYQELKKAKGGLKDRSYLALVVLAV
jgi:hypothetical protein